VRILLTGASSFTGYWFARELVTAGHAVVAPLRRAKDAYSGLRGERVAQLAGLVDIVWSCTFGEGNFLKLVEAGNFDVLCHNAARVGDHRSPDFDIVAALAENTKAVSRLLRSLVERGAKAVVLTGSVFEADEGVGSFPLRAFSPYGVSKGITAAVFRYWCDEFGVPLGKFVIPNPFGPYEEPRFCSYLVNTWRRNEIAEVRTPRYVRDNIHVTLLAKAYAHFTLTTAQGPAFGKLSPSGYVESQGAFARRFSQEVGSRLGLEARVKLANQTTFPEPLVRINMDPVDGARFGWSEAAAWDEIAAYYDQYV
jgi:UDP-glucose 4-epimerase